jgi:hypothetical protein
MKTLELHKTILILIEHNDWRRGKKGAEMQNSTDIGIAIDHAISVLMDVENLIHQRTPHDVEIATKGLEITAGVMRAGWDA